MDPQMAKAVESLMQYPLSSPEMEAVNPGVDIVVYTDLNNVKDIDELFGNGRDCCIILYLLQSATSGHWTCLWKSGDSDRSAIYHYFDSYGEKLDHHLNDLDAKRRAELDEKQDRLKKLLKDKDVIYNNVCWQDPDTSTCGYHVTARLHWKDISEEKYASKMARAVRKSGLTPDQLVVRYYVLMNE